MKSVRNLLVFLISLYLCAFSNKMRGQTYVTIPDPSFVAYLNSFIPSAMNGNQMDTSNIAVTTFTAMSIPSTYSVSNLTGIQYFHSLKSFGCSSNLLTWLPPIPDSVTYFGCTQTQLTSLPSLPKKLVNLSCSQNQLTSLPTLPVTLQKLYCNQNHIVNLPSLPNGLIELNCADNHVLSSLPILPSSLKKLSCPNNQLTSMPPLPDSLQVLEANNNKIACFPPFPNSITQIFIFNNSFTCLPNYINAMNAVTIFGAPLSSYPMCNVDNPNGCPISKDAPTQIVIPNIFTPNGDGINEEFFVKASNLTNFSCKIFDRWGLLIYQWNDVTTGWNGKDKNEGTYYYVITYTDNTNKSVSKNGFFQLIR